MEAPIGSRSIQGSSPPASSQAAPQQTGNLQGRRISLSRFEPHQQVFLRQFAEMFYHPEPGKIEATVKPLTKEEAGPVPSPVPSKPSPANFLKLSSNETLQLVDKIKQHLKEYGAKFPENQSWFLNDLLQVYVECANDQEFFQRAHSLDIPKGEVLTKCFDYFVSKREAVHALKEEYKIYQQNYQNALNIAIKLNEEFLKVFGHEGLGYDAQNGIVLISQSQLEFAKSLAKKYFPQILLFNWTPKQELQNASLIQAIIVGNQIRDPRTKEVFLPKSPACFVLKETQHKKEKGVEKPISQGISFAFKHLVNFLTDAGEDRSPTKTDKFPDFELRKLFNDVCDQFVKDLGRPGQTLSIQGQTINMTVPPSEDKPPLGNILSNTLIQHLKEHPDRLSAIIIEAKQSPILAALNDAYKTHYGHYAVGLTENWFPREVFVDLINLALKENIRLHNGENRQRVQEEMQSFITASEINVDTLERLGLKPEDEITEKTLKHNLQGLLQLKFLEFLILTNQSFAASLILQLQMRLNEYDIPFIRVPKGREYEYGNDLDQFSFKMKMDIMTISSRSENPDEVRDFFLERPVIGEITQSYVVPSISTTTPTPANTPRENVMSDLKISWKTPLKTVDILRSLILPDYQKPTAVDAKKVLEQSFLPKLAQLAALKPGDNLVIDTAGVHITTPILNTVRPYANQALGLLPSILSGPIKQRTGFSAENQYNPLVVEQLTAFSHELDQAIKAYVQQAIAEGQSYSQINEYISVTIATQLAKAHFALQDWGQAPTVVNRPGSFYQMAYEVGSFYLEPTNIAD